MAWPNKTKQNQPTVRKQGGSWDGIGVSVFQLRWSAFRACPGVCVPRFIPCNILQMRTKAGVIMDWMCPHKSTRWSPGSQCDEAWRGAFGRELGLSEVGFLSRCQGRTQQELKLPAPLIWTSQPPELWEINVCCLNHFFFFNSRFSWLNTEGCVCLVTQSCLTLCIPRDCSLPDSSSSCHEFLQVRILEEWIAIPFSRRSSWPRDRTSIHLLCRWILYCLSHQGSP